MAVAIIAAALLLDREQLTRLRAAIDDFLADVADQVTRQLAADSSPLDELLAAIRSRSDD